MNTELNRETVAQAHVAANTAYVTRKGIAAKVNKAGTNPDIASGASIWAKFSDAQFALVVALCAGIDICAGIVATTNVKKVKRLPSFLSFIVTGDVRDLKGSARTMLLECAALVCGAQNRESLTFAATGAVREGETVAIRNQSPLRKLRLLAGSVKQSTEQTQNSVAFSDNGLAVMLGIAKKDTRKSHPVLNEESPILRAMLDRVNATAESTLLELAAPATSDATGATKVKGGKRK